MEGQILSISPPLTALSSPLTRSDVYQQPIAEGARARPATYGRVCDSPDQDLASREGVRILPTHPSQLAIIPRGYGAISGPDQARQDETKTRQDRTRQDKTGQDRTRQGKASPAPNRPKHAAMTMARGVGMYIHDQTREIKGEAKQTQKTETAKQHFSPPPKPARISRGTEIPRTPQTMMPCWGRRGGAASTCGSRAWLVCGM